MCITLLNSQEEQSSDFQLLIANISSYEKTLVTSAGLSRGKHPIALTFFDLEDYEEQEEKYDYYFRQLQDIDKTELLPQDRIAHETMDLKLKGKLDQLKYKLYLIPFNAEGGFYNGLARSVSRLPFKTKEDYDAYLSWLPSVSDYILSLIHI